MFFKRVSNFILLIATALRPVRYTLSILIGLTLSYMVCIKAGFPQHAINLILGKKFPHFQVCVGNISGLFPFKFSIDNIRACDVVSARNIRVKLNVQALRADICIESGEYFEPELTIIEYRPQNAGASIIFETTPPKLQSIDVPNPKFEKYLANLVASTTKEAPACAKTTSNASSDFIHTDVITAVFEFLKKNSKNLHFLRYINSFKLERFKFKGQECSVEFENKELLTRMSGAKLHLKFLDQSYCHAEYVLDFLGGKYRGSIQITEEDIKVHAKVVKHNVSYLENSMIYTNFKFENIHRYILYLNVFLSKNTILEKHLSNQDTSGSGQDADESDKDCALCCNFTIPRCNISGTAMLGNALNVEIFSGIQFANVESVPIITGCVHRNEDKTPVWSFDVAGALMCQGRYSAHQVEIHDIQLKLGNVPITSKNVCVNLSTKIVSSAAVNIGAYKIETSQFSLDDVLSQNAQSELPATREKTRIPGLKWKMSKISLHSASNTIHFGNLCIDGVAERGSCIINCALVPDNNLRAPTKPLNIATKCTIKISEKIFSITALQIDSNGSARVCAKLDAEADTFSNLTAAFTQLANKEPIHDTIRDTVKLNGYIKGTFSLTPISVFLNVGDLIAGIVSLDLHISGSLYSPQLNGTFVLENGLYEHFNNGIVLKNVSLRAKGEGSTLKITHVRLDDGTVGESRPEFDIKNPVKRCASGDGTFALFTPAHVFAPHLNLNLRCNYLQVAYGKIVKARASGDLKMCGPVTGRTDGPLV
ncbi:MAG: hypothetical protein LBJ89_02870, partial [Holosporales bacterium]|nr:hypothetical protein [Holosporales bacterium]